MKFYPYERGGGLKKVLAMLKGGGDKKFWGSFTWKLDVLAILMRGGATSFHSLKRFLVRELTSN